MKRAQERAEPKIFRRGDVWRADLRPAKGFEQTKERLVLIVQNDIANRFSGCVTVVPLTSYKGKKLMPVEVLIRRPEGGTSMDSVIQASQIRTLDKALRFSEFRGTLSSESMSKVDEALKIHLGA